MGDGQLVLPLFGGIVMLTSRVIAAFFCVLFLADIHAQGIAILDRASAAKELGKDYPKEILRKFNLQQRAFELDPFVSAKTGDFYRENLAQLARADERFSRMAQAGWITFSRSKTFRRASVSTAMGNVVYEVTPTQKMLRFVKERAPNAIVVSVGQIAFDRVTGISDNAVEYVTTISLNELAEFVDPEASRRVGPTQQIAYFKKYDDGWRRVEMRY